MTRIGMRVMTRPDVRSNRPAIDARMPRIRLEVADILRRHGDAYPCKLQSMTAVVEKRDVCGARFTRKAYRGLLHPKLIEVRLENDIKAGPRQCVGYV